MSPEDRGGSELWKRLRCHQYQAGRLGLYSTGKRWNERLIPGAYQSQQDLPRGPAPAIY